MEEHVNLSNPFPGLRSFTHDEAELFFGRDNQIHELLKRLKRSRLVAVVGTSGSGKSSLLRAGLIPALRRGYRMRTGSDWRIVEMTPGNNPIGRLAVALRDAAVLGVEDADPTLQATMLEATLRRSDLGLTETIRQARLGENLLLLIDQFEELFRIQPYPHSPHPENQSAAFIRLFLEASAQAELPIYVVLTLRSDYLGDCARFRGLPEAINNGQYLIPRLTREQRQQVIIEPIHLRGAEIAPRLLQRLLNDVGDNPDQLPILQHALLRTWDNWLENHAPAEPLDLPHYEAIGTMAEALERHANEAYQELADERSRQIAEKLFKRLTEKGADNREIRHPTTLRDVCAVTGAEPEAVTAVLDVFRRRGRSFLLPGPGTTLQLDTLLNISHESLIRVWERLKRWVEEEAEAAATYRKLVERMHQFRRGQDTYLANPALRRALEWRQRNQPSEAWALRYAPELTEVMAFLDQSRAQHEQEAADKEATRRRELEQARALAKEQQQRLREQQKAARRLRWFAVALFIVFLIAVGFAVKATVQTWYAQEQKAAAERQRRLSTAREQAMAAINSLYTDPQNSLLVALQAARDTYSVDQCVTAEAYNALNRAVQAVRLQPPMLTANHGAVLRVAFLEAGESRLASAGREGIKIWDTQTRQALLSIATAGINDIALSPNSEQIAAAFKDGTVRVWNLAGASLYTLRGHAAAVTQVAFSPDGTRIATASRDHTAKVWDTGAGELLHPLAGQAGPIVALAFSPDGTELATASWDGTARLWDPDSGQLLHTLTGHREALVALAFSPDGTRLATGSWDKTARLWDAVSGTLLHTLAAHREAVVALAFSPDGTRLATGSWDKTAKLWDAASGQFLETLEGHSGAVTAVAFNPVKTISQLATAGWDKRVKLWDLDSGRLWRTLEGHTDWINAIAFSPDGKLLASAGDDSRVILRTVEPVLHQLDNYSPWKTKLTLNHDGTRLAVIMEGAVQVLDTETGKTVQKLIGDATAVKTVAFSTDGRRIATASGAADTVREYYLDFTSLMRAAGERLTPEQCHQVFNNAQPCPPEPSVGTSQASPMPDFCATSR